MAENGLDGQDVRNAGTPSEEPAQPDTELPSVSSTGCDQSQPGAWSPRLPIPGQQWGKYLIERQLGGGGQALVFQAFDQFGAAGHVALKVPRRPISATGNQAWSRAETEPLAKLHHPNIVRVMDAGCVDNVPYVATELVVGLPLDEHVKNHSLSDKTALDWLIQLAGALAHAHSQGVVHRDIKPQNVIVTPEGLPLILDFGIASLVSAYQPERNTSSSGTPPYMPPEQARGGPGADHRVDIFALGGILRFLLDGAGPYGKTTDPRKAAREGRVHMLDECKGPRMRRALARVANRALQPEADARYANAHEMRCALRRVRSRRWTVAGVGAGVLTVAVVATAVALWRPQSADPSLEAAERADQAFLVGNVEAAQQGYTRVLASPASGPLSRSKALSGLARLESDRGNDGKALSLYFQAIDPNPENVRALAGAAVLLDRMGRSEEALALLQRNRDVDWLVRLAFQIEQAMRLKNRATSMEQLRDLVARVAALAERQPQPQLADEWTSRPVTICFDRFQSAGTPSFFEGEDKVLLVDLTNSAREQGPFEVVSRENVAADLQELELSASAIADPRYGPQLRRLRSARVFVETRIIRRPGRLRISLEAVDVETTVSLAGASGETDGPLDRDMLRDLVSDLTARLRSRLPVRGRISTVDDGQVKLNIGHAVGLREGDNLAVLSDGDLPRVVGELKVRQTYNDHAVATTAQGADQLKEGLRVEKR